jgi:hypothetical protein
MDGMDKLPKYVTSDAEGGGGNWKAKAMIVLRKYTRSQKM